MGASVPAGWPRDLPPAGTEEFDAKVCGWLLDRGPADLRLSPVRTMPVALCRIVARWTDAALEGMRGAYGAARVELSGVMPPDQVAVAQSAIEAEGARLLQVQREITLVEAAVRRQAGEI